MSSNIDTIIEEVFRMGLALKNEGWRLSEALWVRMAPLPPPRKPHPLGCHNPRVPDRQAKKAILFVLRTGCQWNALNAAGLCSSSSAHWRFMERTEAGVFHAFRQEGLLAYDGLKGGDWSRLSLDGAMTKASLAGAEKSRPHPHRSRQARHQAQPIDRRGGTAGQSGD
jgi:transposase